MRKKLLLSALIITSVFSAVFGQDKGNEASADRTLRGSGRVNASTLGMEFDLPLGAYSGRGINIPVTLNYSSKVWRMQYLGNNPVAGGNYSPCYPFYFTKFAEESASGWTSSLTVPYIEYIGAGTRYNTDGTGVTNEDAECPNSGGSGGSYPNSYVKRILVHLPGGETHELRVDDAIISFTANGNTDPNGPYQAGNWNATYYAADSSNLKYVQNSATNTYRLLMPDGSFYDFDPATPHEADRKALKFTDRNGNFTTYYAPGSVDDQGITHPNGYWKDTLGRNISVPLGLQAPTTPTTANAPQIYKMPGMTGEYKLQWKHLKGNSAEESALKNFSENLRYMGDTYGCTNSSGNMIQCQYPSNSDQILFSGGGYSTSPRIMVNEIFNPIILTEITLPTGQKYKFKYDVYGRISQIIYPTGGREEFEYAVVATLSMLEYGDVTAQTNFGVVNRKVYKSATDSLPYEWTYSANYVTAQAGYQVSINNPDGTRVERLLHRGYDSQNSNLGKFGYDNGLAGMAYEERTYDSSSPRKLVSKHLTTWTKTTLNQIADWHPRVTKEESIIYDSTAAGISATTTLGYENEAQLNLRETPVLTKKSSQYAFVTAGSALPSAPLRTSETTFLINDPAYPQWVQDTYRNQNMIGLVSSSVVKDGAGTVVSRSEMKYDDGSSSPALGRGNPTSLRVWDSTKGTSDNPNAYITTYAKFDQWGNQYETTDANGNVTATVYDSVYHTYPIQVTSAIPDPSGANGSNTAFITTATFDPVTGIPLTMTDANGLESRIEYDPATLRPLRTKTYFNNQQIGSESETIYHDEPNNCWVKNRAKIDTNKWSESISYFDGLGRAYKAEKVNSQGNIFVEKEFDAEGRVKRVTNPFRTNETKQWTTNVYDESSRVKEVVLPDGAKVKTDYGVSTSGIIGVTKQITDQAGKKRKGISDALGRMIRVIEDPDNANLNTDYVFDTLGNLRKTIQGEQSRYFTYDSLGRLLYAKQPEQEANTAFSFTDPITNNAAWSVKYEYDDNGNITKTTDARNVSVTGTYDNFNRLKKRDYSDATADVDFYYDGRGLPSIPNFSKGKTTRVASSVSETRYTSFDNLGRLLTHQQMTDGRTYNTGYQYNLTSLVSETYPSGRTVKMDYDQDGDVSSVWGTVGTQNRLYANAVHYNSAGNIERLRLGNGKWETAKYNNRQQVTEIGLGSSATDQSLLKLEYGYGDNTQNNGSMRSQKISFNGLNQPFEQTYTYDNLNRLQSAEEKISNQTNWKQTFHYDRYGNRTFDAANTTTLSQFVSTKINNPQIQTSDNRLKKDQDNDSINDYDYDKAGNVKLDAENKRFVYDAENHLTALFNSSNNTSTPDATYHYDGDGKRVKKISSTETTVFVYDGSSQLVAEYSTQITQTPQVSYLTQDHLGSPRIITDQTGKIIARKDFSAFGDETITAQRTTALGYKPETIRQDYTGYQKDDESNLEYAQARYYNSSHGRFTSVDPLTASASIRDPQTFNRYSYAMNSPYKFTDPLGLISSSTGACGQWCRNSDGSSGGYSSNYSADDNQQQDNSAAPVGDCTSGECGEPGKGEQGEPERQQSAQDSAQDVDTSAKMSPSEKLSAQLFGGPSAYFSNPNDGDPVDQTTGLARNSADARKDPENHLYPSMTNPNARSGFYVPDGGKYVGETTYTDGNGEKVRVILIYFAKLGGQKNFTIAVYHLININTAMPKGPDGRRKLGDLGEGAGGAISYRQREHNGRYIWKKGGVHAHIEIYQGRHTSLPELGKKPHINFNRIVE